MELLKYLINDNPKNKGKKMDSMAMMGINSYLVVSGAMATVLIIALLLKLLERILN